MIWLMVACFFLFIALGVPIAFSIGASALLYVLASDISLVLIAQRFFSNTESFAFLAVPFFVLTGSLMVHASIAEKIIKFADTLVRQFKGGLGCVSVVTNMIMAGVSGSSVADCAAVGSVIIPEMKRTGYHASFASALNASASVVGIIIPPSSTMIIIAYLTNLSVGKMFLAGAIPGILICAAFFAVVVYVAKKRDYPQGTRATLGEILASARDASWALVLPFFLVGSIIFGIATATEAAALSALYAFAAGVFVYRTLDFPKMMIALREAVYSTTVVMIIVCTSTIFTWVLIAEGIPQLISELLLGLGLPIWGMKLMIIGILLIAGMVMDNVPNLFIFIPILFPIAAQIGFDPIHFSIVLLCTLALGLFTPPVGTTLFLSCLLADATIEETSKDLVLFFAAGVISILLITFVPQLSLWLPGLVFTK